MGEPLNNLRIILAALSGVAAISSAHAGEVTFQNDLRACAAITAVKISTQVNLVLANTDIKLSKSIGDCRCLSALASYTSSVEVGGVRQILQSGLIGLDIGGARTFVLASDPALVVNRKVQVTFSCAGPL
ncbi:DUF2195 family protein [Massilia sp. CCM 8694]|uniref:DUF2195 family protein n=1 Tax=Massilia genomosp. 1 TaxID=2609280 RepID=A0ABX0N3Q7_9BURK|nr:DUF2195 family protein [Massilia genomosp. 1]